MQLVHTVFLRVAFHWRAITPLVSVLCRSFGAGIALALVPHSSFWCTKIILVLMMEVDVGRFGCWRAGLLERIEVSWILDGERKAVRK
jgi:hypothetical protein